MCVWQGKVVLYQKHREPDDWNIIPVRVTRNRRASGWIMLLPMTVGTMTGGFILCYEHLLRAAIATTHLTGFKLGAPGILLNLQYNTSHACVNSGSDWINRCGSRNNRQPAKIHDHKGWIMKFNTCNILLSGRMCSTKSSSPPWDTFNRFEIGKKWLGNRGFRSAGIFHFHKNQQSEFNMSYIRMNTINNTIRFD